MSCPLGVYYGYPDSTAGNDGVRARSPAKGIEPLDKKSVFVDMNRNGVWDYRETPTQAWRRLGLLQPNETLTREKYVACVQNAAETLRKERLLLRQDRGLVRRSGQDRGDHAEERDAVDRRSPLLGRAISGLVARRRFARRVPLALRSSRSRGDYGCPWATHVRRTDAPVIPWDLRGSHSRSRRAENAAPGSRDGLTAAESAFGAMRQGPRPPARLPQS